MAWIVADSFDYYGTIADVARSVWDSVTTTSLTLNAAITRFGVGQSLRIGGTSALLQKTVATNEATLLLACAYYRATALAGTNAEWYWQLRDGATAQCTVVFESSGNLVLKSGGPAGTVLATYTGAFAQDVWTHFQIRVVISNTAGSMTVRKNGQTSDTYASATNLNTRGGTTNNYANVVALSSAVSPTNFNYLEDVLIYSATAPAPNDWIGDVRAVCLAPAVDTAQKQFTPLTATGTLTNGSSSTVSSHVPNQIRFGAFVSTRSGVLTNATVNYNTTFTGAAQVALYAPDAAGGMPGTLLGVSAVVTNPTTGVNNFAVSAGPTLVQGRTYWLAYSTNIATHSLVNTGGSSYFQATPYASGFPNPCGAVSAGAGGGTLSPLLSTLTLSGNVTQVSEALANSDTDYVFDSTVGDSDLYDMDDLPTTPASVIGVVSKIYVKKSDAGARQGQLLLSSGGTQVAGTDTVLGTTYTYLARVDTVDPATGVAWTPAAVNAVKIGQKVTA